MKLFYQTLFGSGLLLQLASAQIDRTPYGYKNFVTKTQLPGTTEMYSGEFLSSSGKMPGEKFTKTGGIWYRLYTVRNSPTGLKPAGKVPLDEVAVGLFIPRAPLVISSVDPYISPGSTVRRTRADRGFTVNITPSGLVADLSKHECFRKVNLFTTMQSFGPGDENAREVPVPNTNALIAAPTLVLSENTTFSFPFDVKSLTPLGKERACGQVVFESKSLRDDQIKGQEIEEKILGSQVIKVWPVSTGSVLPYQGMGQVFKGNAIPDIVFQGTNLYPLSETYIQYYFGSYVPGKIGEDLPNIAANRSETSVHKKVSAGGLTKLFNKDGKWTLVLKTRTPESFNDDLHLIEHEVEVDRSIIVNTTLTTSE